MRELDVTPITYDKSYDTTILPDGTIRIDGLGYRPIGAYRIPSTLLGRQVTGIGEWAFAVQSGLTSISIHGGIRNIGANAFFGTASLTGIDVDQGNEFFASLDGILYNRVTAAFTHIPAALSGSVNISYGIRTISSSDFAGRTGLTGVTIPASVTRIEQGAFANTGIWNNTPWGGVVYAGNWAVGIRGDFAGAVTLRGDTVGIGDAAFMESEIRSLTIPGSVTRVGTNIFANAHNNPSVIWHYNPALTAANFSAYLTQVNIPPGIQSIPANTFRNARRLTSITIPNSVTAIGNWAFENTGLTAVTIPGGVRTIGSGAFLNCTSLRSVTFLPNNNLTAIGGSAFQNTGITSVALPSGITAIGSFAFADNTWLINVSFGAHNNLSLIEFGAFMNTRLTSITLPASASIIDQNVFWGCGFLTVYMEAATPPGIDTKHGTIENWNPGSRPVILGVTLSADRTHVVSFVRTASSIQNQHAPGGITAPHRAGFTFGGWATRAGGPAVFTASNIHTAPVGTTLFAIWL